MIQGVAKVRVGVRDQERAKRVWVETLQCEVAQDEASSDERWLEVRLPLAVVLILEVAPATGDSTSPGQPNTPLFLRCDDIDATWRELVARGVTFSQEPVDMPFGRGVLMDDTEGNRIPLLSASHPAQPPVVPT